MIQERINRVINNHQLSCQNTNRNLYILIGFDPFINNIEFPLKPVKEALENENGYILFQAYSEKYEDYFVPVYVIFNFFDGGVLNQNWKIDQVRLNNYEKLYIFNRKNPLLDVVDDNLSDVERIKYIKEVMV